MLEPWTCMIHELVWAWECKQGKQRGVWTQCDSVRGAGGDCAGGAMIYKLTKGARIGWWNILLALMISFSTYRPALVTQGKAQARAHAHSRTSLLLEGLAMHFEISDRGRNINNRVSPRPHFPHSQCLLLNPLSLTLQSSFTLFLWEGLVRVIVNCSELVPSTRWRIKMLRIEKLWKENSPQRRDGERVYYTCRGMVVLYCVNGLGSGWGTFDHSRE